MSILKKIWNKIKQMWKKLLVALGIIAVAPIVLSQVVNFSYTPATEYTDGSAMPLNEIAETVLYCNGSEVQRKPGADGSFNPNLVPGRYVCYATHIATNGLESGPSNEVTKVVGVPGAPQNLTVE